VVTHGLKKYYSLQTKSLDVYVDDAYNSRAIPVAKANNAVGIYLNTLMIRGRLIGPIISRV